MQKAWGAGVAVLSILCGCSRSGLRMPCGPGTSCDMESEVCCAAVRCVPVGTCCTDEDCAPGSVCAGGTCGPGDLGCGVEDLGQTAPPNFVLLLDRSGSMEDPIDGRRKWDIAKDSLGAVLPDFDGLVRYGLMMFPGPEAYCTPGQIDVEVGDASSEDVLDAIPENPLHTTPIGMSLEVLRGYAGLDDGGRGNFILLITDGFESCGGDPISEAAALAADTPPVRVYVVGFGDLVDVGELTAIAEAAGTVRPGGVAYWRAGNRSELSDAIGEVASAVTSCAWTLTLVPPLPDELFVYFDDAPVAHDASHEDGWDYDAPSNTITFYGDSCRGVESGHHHVRVVFGCP